MILPSSKFSISASTDFSRRIAKSRLPPAMGPDNEGALSDKEPQRNEI